MAKTIKVNAKFPVKGNKPLTQKQQIKMLEAKGGATRQFRKNIKLNQAGKLGQTKVKYDTIKLLGSQAIAEAGAIGAQAATPAVIREANRAPVTAASPVNQLIESYGSGTTREEEEEKSGSSSNNRWQ